MTSGRYMLRCASKRCTLATTTTTMHSSSRLSALLQQSSYIQGVVVAPGACLDGTLHVIPSTLYSSVPRCCHVVCLRIPGYDSHKTCPIPFRFVSPRPTKKIKQAKRKAGNWIKLQKSDAIHLPHNNRQLPTFSGGSLLQTRNSHKPRGWTRCKRLVRL